MELDRDCCVRALDARDPRFDGVFFVGIASTGIYCRPICPARRARRDRCSFFTTAAAAEQAGFRPCLRCRPELAPGRSRVDAVPRLVQAAARRIAAGALNGHSVDDLAEELHVSGRQLRRAMKHELGVTPVELAQTHRLLLAKQLLTETDMSVSRIAYTSGFQSLRRFNAVFRDRYRLNPRALRRGRGRLDGTRFRLRLAYRPPLAWPQLLETLAAQAIPGVEHVDRTGYGRTVRIGGHAGTIRVEGSGDLLHVSISTSLLPALMMLLPRIRALFDLDAEPVTIDEHLANAGLRALVRRCPGLRVPGAFDGFEVAMRVVTGHRTPHLDAVARMGRLAAAFGEKLPTDDRTLSRLAVTPERIAEVRLSDLAESGLTPELARMLQSLARHVLDGSLRLTPDADAAVATRVLTEQAGMEPVLAAQIAMRAVSWPDALLVTDPQLCRAIGVRSPQDLRKAAEPWRPWRAYGALYLLLPQPASPAAGSPGRRRATGRRVITPRPSRLSAAI